MDFAQLLTPLVNLADKLGMLQAVRGKLIKQPDPAAQELATVLEELAKTYEAILSELSRYLSVTFYEGQPPRERELQRTELVKLETSAIDARIGNARTRCAKIDNIYRRFLSPWFSKVLSPDETRMMEELFLVMTRADKNLILIMSDHFATWLSRQASKRWILSMTETSKKPDNAFCALARRLHSSGKKWCAQYERFTTFKPSLLPCRMQCRTRKTALTEFRALHLHEPFPPYMS